MSLSQIGLFAGAAGVAGSAWLSGNIIAISTMTMPSLIQNAPDMSPTAAMRIWRGVFERGKRLAPLTAIVALAAYAVAVYAARQADLHSGSTARGMLAAALLTVAIVPFTLLVMGGTNRKLLAGAAAASSGGGDLSVQAAVELLRTWARLNLVRGLLPLAGAVVGFWTLLG